MHRAWNRPRRRTRRVVLLLRWLTIRRRLVITALFVPGGIIATLLVGHSLLVAAAEGLVLGLWALLSLIVLPHAAWLAWRFLLVDYYEINLSRHEQEIAAYALGWLGLVGAFSILATLPV